jgi:hypothetical protein
MKKDLSKLSKKELKDFINSNGFFCTALITEKNMPNEESRPENVPEGATWFRGVASTEELNRNGYIIRLNAWKSAISEFMNNPVLLLQHDSNQPIGKVLTAEVGERGLIITGYLFDDLTGGRFGRGLINALSTGHLTVDVEFENTSNGEILSEEEFKKLSWEEQSKEEWVMAVKELEWVELSVVSIGANRKSLISNKELMKNYLNELQPEEVKAEEVVEEQKEEVAEVSEDQKEQVSAEEQAQEEAEKEGENPDAEVSESENDEEKSEADVVSVPAEDIAEAKNAILSLAEVVKKQKAELEEMRNVLANIPQPKGLTNTVSREEKKEASWLQPLLEQNGIL